MTLFGDLHDLMKPPALYERTDAAFWDDEHISRGMLAAHLDPEFEGASRSFAFMDRSVDWICATAPPATHPRLLDLGCGPGLYAERFARAGYAVTGVDLSPRSLDHARRSANEQGLAIDYRCRNYLELDLDGSFDIAVMIYCDYGALSSDERRVVLRRVRERLRPFESSALFLDWWRFAGAAPEDGFSFPSGHMTAASAAMAALMLAYRNWKTVLGGSLVMLVMGAARCYLVVHYPTDVLAGLLVGALAAVAAQLLVSFAFRRYGERRFARPRHACAPVRRRR